MFFAENYVGFQKTLGKLEAQWHGIAMVLTSEKPLQNLMLCSL